MDEVVKARHQVLQVLSGYSVLALALLLPAMLMTVDVHLFEAGATEDSFTEYTQSLILFLTVGVFCYTAWRYRSTRGFTLLAAALFLCMLIREQNNMLIAVHTGLWETLVAIVFVIAVSAVGLKRYRFWQPLADFLSSRSGGLMAAALLFLLIFSRTFSDAQLWHYILDDGYTRVAVHAIEEGSELATYVTMLFAAGVYHLSLRRRRLNREA